MQNFQNDHPKREEMIARLGEYFSLSEIAVLRELKRLYAHYPYMEIIRPLVRVDKARHELSYTRIAIKYGISRRQGWRLVNGTPQKRQVEPLA